MNKKYVGLGLILVSLISIGHTLRGSDSSIVARPFIHLLRPQEEMSSEDRDNKLNTMAYCHSEDYEKAERDEHQKYFNNPQTMTKNILGLQITDQKEKIEILELALHGVEKNLLLKYSAACKDALCVIYKLTGSKEAALRVFNMKKRTSYTMNFAQYSFQGPYTEEALWTAAEIRDVETGLQLLPKQFQNLSTLTYIRKSPVTDVFGAAYAVAPYENEKYGYILMLKKGLNVDNTIHTVVHEVGHHYDFSTSGLLNDFGKLNDKVHFQFPIRDFKTAQINLKESKKPEDGYTSQYAATNFTEDFAESVADYVIKSNHAYSYIPSKYDYLKEKVFKSYEYRSQMFEQMPELDLNKMGQWLVTCTEQISHMTIKDDQFGMGLGDSTYIISANYPEPMVMRNYKSCLLASALPVKDTVGKDKVCSSMGFHHQFRANMIEWVNRFASEMYDVMLNTVSSSQKSGIPKPEMMKSLEGKLFAMDTTKLLQETHRKKIAQSLLKATQYSLNFMEYRPEGVSIKTSQSKKNKK